MFGKCKICIEKENRIAELKEQIAYFKSVLNPPPRIHRYELEEDALMDGGGKDEVSLDDIKAEEAENIAIQQESDFIFSGNDERAEV